jgi:hypothetical protein
VQSGEVKEGMDLSLLFLHRQGLAGRPRPTCRLQGSSRRSGRFPALSSAGANWVCSLGFNCGWPAARVEDTEAAKRQKKRRHLAQSLAQRSSAGASTSPRKLSVKMELFLWKPAQAGQMRVEREQRRLATRRKFEGQRRVVSMGAPVIIAQPTKDQQGS